MPTVNETRSWGRGVSDLVRSSKFYDATMAALGYARVFTSPGAIGPGGCFPDHLCEHHGEHRGIRDIESSWGVANVRGAHRAYTSPDLRGARQRSGFAGGRSLHWLCKITDSLDLYALVVTPGHGPAEFGHVLTGVDCFCSKRPHS